MSNIIESIKERAKKNKKTIVLPETMDRRTLEATEKILKFTRLNMMSLKMRFLFQKLNYIDKEEIITTRQTGGLHLAYKARFSS